jgi:hypothetical protein
MSWPNWTILPTEEGYGLSWKVWTEAGSESGWTATKERAMSEVDEACRRLHVAEPPDQPLYWNTDKLKAAVEAMKDAQCVPESHETDQLLTRAIHLVEDVIREEPLG